MGRQASGWRNVYASYSLLWRYFEKICRLTKRIPRRYIRSQFALIDVLTYREKIYCLYALEFDEETKSLIKPDRRIIEFVDTAVIIHNTKEFLSRVCYAMLDSFKNDFWTSFQSLFAHGVFLAIFMYLSVQKTYNVTVHIL